MAYFIIYDYLPPGFNLKLKEFSGFFFKKNKIDNKAGTTTRTNYYGIETMIAHAKSKKHHLFTSKDIYNICTVPTSSNRVLLQTVSSTPIH